ncbi:hypothetical protein ACMD2_23909 [Ananas comosus]|uniref:Calcineurin-like phosphoesterase domain-containing protein n=1 Tax=Ananas comosus TaxID=4615 RepID=A0A199UMG0_ANACO|nr:hypothetical protein ACMD2_23909 [Ananas comosus]
MLMAMVRSPPSQSLFSNKPILPRRIRSPEPRNHLPERENRCAKSSETCPQTVCTIAAVRRSPRGSSSSPICTRIPENMAWVRRLSRAWHGGDVLVVAGDVAETYKNFVSTMAELKERSGPCSSCPGIMTCGAGEKRANSELGVETGPRTIDGLGIIPLFSWYHKACKDFHACKWSPQLSNDGVALALHFDMMNETNHNAIKEVQTTSNHIITFSHFVPRQELCPEKRMLFYPNLPKIIGSDFLEKRLRSIHGNFVSGSACHLFGHTHFCWDSVVDGIRYVQAPLAYPRERKRRMNGGEDWLPFCIYFKGFTDKLSPAYWSDYYSENKREPKNTDLAPWVARFYTSFSERHILTFQLLVPKSLTQTNRVSRSL